MTNSIEIVLVEDNPNDADLILRALKKNKVANTLLHLKDGQAALDYIFGKGEEKIGDKQTPKLILLDIKMPKVSGIDVLKRLKSDDRTKVIPVVILTFSKEDPAIKECYRLGANSYVVKPLAFDGFSKTVSQLGLYRMLINQPFKL